MKYCPNCNANLPDTAMFCGICGTSVAQVQPQAQPQPAPQFQSPPQAQPQTVVYEVVTQPKKGGRKKALIISGVALLLVAAVVVTGIFTNWFGLISSVSDLGEAFLNTLKADSLSASYNIDASYNSLYGNAEIVVDENRRNVTMISNMNGEERLLITDDIVYSLYSYGYDVNADIDHGIGYNNAFFQMREALDEGIVGCVETLSGSSFEEIIRNSELGDYVVAETAQELINDFVENCLNDEGWLKTYLGLEKNGNTYTFNIDIVKIVEGLYERYKNSDYITNYCKDQLENTFYFDTSRSEPFKLTITLDGRYVSNIEYAIADEKMSLRIFDVNKTVITDSEKDDIKSAVERIEYD